MWRSVVSNRQLCEKLGGRKKSLLLQIEVSANRILCAGKANAAIPPSLACTAGGPKAHAKLLADCRVSLPPHLPHRLKLVDIWAKWQSPY